VAFSRLVYAGAPDPTFTPRQPAKASEERPGFPPENRD
jgi:hypothetical protein